MSTRTRRRLEVRGGITITLRVIRPGDRDALRAAFIALSPESRYQRFMGHVSGLSPAMWRYLTEVDGRDHVALVAEVTAPGHPSDGDIVGVARFVRSREDRSCAEVAVTVVDAFQRRGVGLALVEMLTSAARERKVRTFVAHALRDNRAIVRLLARVGEVSSSAPDGVLRVSLVTPADGRRRLGAALRREIAAFAPRLRSLCDLFVRRAA